MAWYRTYEERERHLKLALGIAPSTVYAPEQSCLDMTGPHNQLGLSGVTKSNNRIRGPLLRDPRKIYDQPQFFSLFAPDRLISTNGLHRHPSQSQPSRTGKGCGPFPTF